MDIKELNIIITAVKLQRSRLIIICGVGKENLKQQCSVKYGIKNINISQALAKKLLSIPSARRSMRVQRCLTEILRRFDDEILWLDRIQLLFYPELKFDTVQFFQNASRNKTLLLAWEGTYKNNKLIYAEPGHPEYKVFSEIDPYLFRG